MFGDVFKSLEFLNQVDFGLVSLVVKVGGVALAVIAVAAGIYILKAVFAPSIRIVQFLFAYTPGSRPNDITAGAAHGVRLVAWSALLGIVVWFLAH